MQLDAEGLRSRIVAARGSPMRIMTSVTSVEGSGLLELCRAPVPYNATNILHKQARLEQVTLPMSATSRKDTVCLAHLGKDCQPPCFGQPLNWND